MTTNEMLLHRVVQLEEECKLVQSKLDRMMLAMISLCVSLSVSAVVFALTVASQG